MLSATHKARPLPVHAVLSAPLNPLHRVCCRSFYVASTFLTLSERLNWSGAFYFYAAAAAASFFFYLLFVPETNGLPLEVITPLFKDPKALVRANLRSSGFAAAKKPAA